MPTTYRGSKVCGAWHCGSLHALARGKIGFEAKRFKCINHLVQYSVPIVDKFYTGSAVCSKHGGTIRSESSSDACTNSSRGNQKCKAGCV